MKKILILCMILQSSYALVAMNTKTASGETDGIETGSLQANFLGFDPNDNSTSRRHQTKCLKRHREDESDNDRDIKAKRKLNFDNATTHETCNHIG